jgi:hypothetical protein
VIPQRIISRYLEAGANDSPSSFWTAYTGKLLKSLKLPKQFEVTDVKAHLFGELRFYVEVKQDVSWPDKEGLIATVRVSLRQDKMAVFIQFGGGIKPMTFPLDKTSTELGTEIGETIAKSTKSLREQAL